MQREPGHGEIERGVRKRERLLVGGNAPAPAAAQERQRALDVDEALDAGRAGESPRDEAVVRPDVGSEREPPLDQPKPLGEILPHPGEQEVVRGRLARMAVAPPQEQIAVEDQAWL